VEDAAARGAGVDSYLITTRGKLIRKLEFGWSDVMDAEAGLIYRMDNHTLTATRVESGEPAWSPSSTVEHWHGGSLISGVDDVLVIMEGGVVRGYDKKSGHQVYQTNVGKFRLPKSYVPGYSRGVAANGEHRNHLYLIDEENETLHHPDGHMSLRAVRAPVIAKMDLLTGHKLWQQSLATNTVVYSIEPGVAGGQPVSFCFDPTTGKALRGVTSVSGERGQIMASGGQMIVISNDTNSTVNAYDPGTQQIRWRLSGLGRIREILQLSGRDRLLCVSDSEMLVIDTNRKRVTVKFPVAEWPNLRLLPTERALLLRGIDAIRAVDPATGRTIWARETKDRGLQMTLAGDNAVVFVESKLDEQTHQLTFELVAVAIDTGNVLWHWHVPPGPHGDSVAVKIQSCKSGLIVQRSWMILD
jgi:outer membrane protein assembly factor BamB